MKKIQAIIRPETLEPLKEALLEAKVNGITINQVFGCGNQLGWTEYVRGNVILMNTLSKMEVTIVVPDFKVEDIVNVIMSVSETGEVGDGKIFISDVQECIRIRTKERGEAAL